MNVNVRLFCLAGGIVLFFTLSSMTLAQPKSKKPSATKKPRAISVTKSENKPFNYTLWDELPPNYAGHDFGELLRALVSRDRLAARGEYESTIDYNRRLERLNERPLVGTTNFKSRLAFTFLPDSKQFEMKYDPDMAALDISLKWHGRYEFVGHSRNLLALTWANESRRVSSYIGRNAFNRSVRVTVYRNDSYYLVSEKQNLEQQKDVNFVFNDAKLVTSIPMQPADARLAKTNLRWLVIGHLADNPLLTSNSRFTPTITDPYDNYNFSYAIKLVIEEIWLYDYRTGNVHLRF